MSLDKARLYEERKQAREAMRKQKQEVAERHKEKGNQFYNNGEYVKAINCYERAVAAYGPKAVYMNNLAAAYMKADRYKEAEVAAGTALRREPKLWKARLRRGVCRLRMRDYEGALPDIIDVLNVQPTCPEALEARRALAAVGVKPKPRRPDSYETAILRDQPRPEDPPTSAKTPVTSDSEDYKHQGEGHPCRDYNHDGCRFSGTRNCRFMHAPDLKSVRDDLGKNVCLTFIYGKCRLGAARCPYAHDKSYISQRSLNDATAVNDMRAGVEMIHGEYAPEAIEAMAPMLVDPMKSALWIPRLRDRHMSEVNRERHEYIAQLKRDEAAEAY